MRVLGPFRRSRVPTYTPFWWSVAAALQEIDPTYTMPLRINDSPDCPDFPVMVRPGCSVTACFDSGERVRIVASLDSDDVEDNLRRYSVIAYRKDQIESSVDEVLSWNRTSF